MPTYDIKVVSHRLGVSTRTITFLIKEGLVRARVEHGEIRFEDEDVNEIARIVRLRDLGINLAGIEVILEMRRKMLTLKREIDELSNEMEQEFEVRLRRRFPQGSPPQLSEKRARELIEIIVEEEERD